MSCIKFFLVAWISTYFNFSFAQNRNDSIEANKYYKIVNVDSCIKYLFISVNHRFFLDSISSIKKELGSDIYKKVSMAKYSIPDYYVVNKKRNQYLRIVTTGNAADAIQMNIGIIKNKKFNKQNVIYSTIDNFFITSDIKLGVDFSYLNSKFNLSCYQIVHKSYNTIEIRSTVPDSINTSYRNYQSHFIFKNNKLVFCEITLNGVFVQFDKMYYLPVNFKI